APGAHTVAVTDGSSNSASAQYTINTPSIGLSPSSGNVGASVTLSGSNFPASSSITATHDSGGLTLCRTTTTTASGAIPSGATFNSSSVTLGGTTTTDSNGSFSAATYTVPGLAAGSYTVAVTDASSNSGSASYTVTFGPVAKLALAAASTNPTAGATNSLTI